MYVSMAVVVVHIQAMSKQSLKWELVTSKIRSVNYYLINVVAGSL